MSEQINISEKIDDGYIHVRTIIEMLGMPKEHVIDTLKSYVNKLDESDDFIVLNEGYSDPEEKENMFSVFVEVEMLVKGVENVSFYCFDYLPASIEILEPTSLKYSSHHLTDFLNDLLGRLHSLDMNFKTDKAKIDKLNANSEALIKNFLGYLLKDNSKSLKELSGPLGIPEEGLKLLLNRFIGEEYLKKEDDKYSLSDNVKKISPKSNDTKDSE